LTPQAPTDADEAKRITSIIEGVVFTQNNGWFLFHDIIDTALKSRNSVAQVNWEAKTVKDVHDVQADAAR
jgi:hypothetical protein